MKALCRYIVLFLLLCGTHIQAQDVHFSQYYFSPLTLNPANTGNYHGDYRFFGNYRSQWRELDKAFNTFSAGGDMNLYPKNINVSPGLFVLRDRSAAYLTVTKIMPSFAIHRKIAGFKFNLGLQPGIVIKAIDFYKHSFPNQLNWGTGQFDPNLPNTEPHAGQSFTYFDLNAGFSVSRKIGKVEPELGFAAFHLNSPKESFLDNANNRLPLRNAVNGSITYSVTSKVITKVHSMYGYTTKATDWVSGLQIEYVLSRDVFYANSVFAGFMWRDGFKRNSDAGIATIGFNYGPYTIGFSYDITMSELKTAVNSKGAYEIALIYRAKSTRLTKRVIPCDRY